MASTERQNSLLVAEDWTKIYQTFQNADFKSYDFETIRRSMIEYLRQNYPENFNDYIDSSEYVALIDMIAFLAQSLSFRIDLNARENFMDTAQRRDSILKLAKLISYNPKRTQTSNGLLKLSSVSTTENLIDSNGTNLSNKLVVWNDGTNSNWYQQFTYIMNATMSTATFGKPNVSKTINSIANEQYDLNVVTNDVPIFTFNKSIGGVPMTFEIVGSTMIDRTDIGEQPPKLGSTFGIIYKNDNKGSASKNSGWFVQFKEGILQSSDFQVTNPIANEIIGVDVQNINDTDVWLYDLDTNNSASTLWTKLESVSGNNVVYNSLKNKVKTFYSVSTRENDQIDLNFSDGVFGKLPLGNFRLYYRTSNGLSYVISPQDMSNVLVRVPYISKSGQTHTMSMTLDLQYSVSNSATSETNDSIKQNAPQVYYTQNRMITGEDYNILPLTVSQDIIKIKSLNRVASGVSRYFDINDPTGRSSSINLFADDGALYRDIYTTNFSFTFDTKNEVYGLVKSTIEPLLAKESMRDFYYEMFDRIIVGNSSETWKNASVQPNQATGYFQNENTSLAVAIGQYTQSSLRHVKPEALVKFVPPTGKYFAPNNTLTSVKSKNTRDYIWSEVTYITGDGSNLGKGVTDYGIGLVGISTPVPDGAVPVEIIPLFVTDIPFAFESEIVNQITLRRDFGIRYDRDSSEWKIVNVSNLDLDGEFSLTYSGDVSNTKLDASWLIAFKSDGDRYITYYRGLDYVFQSTKQISFYFNEQDKKYSSKLGSQSKDNIVVLSVNENIETGAVLGQNYTFEITGMLANLDGYYDNNRIKLSFLDTTGDGIVDDPDSFDNIVMPELIDAISGTKRSFVFLRTVESDDQVYTEILDSSLVLTFNSELDIVNTNIYDDGQLFYFYSPLENVIKRLDKAAGLEVVNSITAQVGRPDIKFQYIHTASQDYRIDPCKTNIIDIYLLTKTYDDSLRTWIINQDGDPPLAPSSDQLYDLFSNQLNTVKAISDEIVFHPAKYKLLFGTGADINLQSQFYIVKNTNSVTNDNDIKSRVIVAINEYFSLENWDFGDTFNFGELSAYVIKQLSPDVVNFLIVPRAPEKYFGSLFQVFCQPDEIFLSTAEVQDLEIINTVTSGLLKTNGPIVVSVSTNG
jgi:hypothetical protein